MEFNPNATYDFDCRTGQKKWSINEDAKILGLTTVLQAAGDWYLMSPDGLLYSKGVERFACERNICIGFYNPRVQVRKEDPRFAKFLPNVDRVGCPRGNGKISLTCGGTAQQFLSELGGMELGSHTMMLEMEMAFGKQTLPFTLFNDAIDFGNLDIRGKVTFTRFDNGEDYPQNRDRILWYTRFFRYEKSNGVQSKFLGDQNCEIKPRVLTDKHNRRIRSGKVGLDIEIFNCDGLFGKRLRTFVNPFGLRGVLRGYSAESDDKIVPTIYLFSEFGSVPGITTGLFAVKKLEAK